MASLGFEILDRHVIGGGADDPVIGRLTYARLLEQSAALAAGLRAIGVAEGDVVDVRVADQDRVLVVAACVRIGVVPGAEGDVVVEPGDDGAVVRLPDDTHLVDLLRRVGAGDPAAALATDADGYRDAVREHAADVVDALLERRPVG